jgi:hypothetical protein
VVAGVELSAPGGSGLPGYQSALLIAAASCATGGVVAALTIRRVVTLRSTARPGLLEPCRDPAWSRANPADVASARRRDRCQPFDGWSLSTEDATMRDEEILGRVQALVDREHELRAGASVDDDEVQHLDETLDQCWDLLRQRRARRAVGDDPDAATPRPTDVVEGHQQ